MRDVSFTGYTASTICTALSEINDISWKINSRGWLRGKDADGRQYCPITAVCRHDLQVYYAPGEVRKARHAMLVEENSYAVLLALADDEVCPYNGKAERERFAALWAKLCKCCGVAQDATA